MTTRSSRPLGRILYAIAAVLVISCGGGGPTAADQDATNPQFVGPTGLASRLNTVAATLAANPPTTSVGTAVTAARRTAIADLDQMLFSISVGGAPGADISAWYRNAMDKLASEMAAPVTDGVRIWAGYNAGFIVKSASGTVAFDFIDDRPGLPTDLPKDFKLFKYTLPAGVVNQINVLTISHEHTDHTGFGGPIAGRVKANGGAVFYPRDGAPFANATQLADSGATYTVNGITIKAYAQKHTPTPSRLYEVTLPNGYRIVHADGETALLVDKIKNVDVLLLNNWVNGANLICKDAFIQVMNAMKPGLTIPSHIQELSHDASGSGLCRPGENLAGRKTYADWLDVQDQTNLPSKFALLTWGEKIDYKR